MRRDLHLPASTRMAYCTPSQNVPRKIFYIGKRVSSASWARTDPPEGPSGLYANIWKYYFFDVGSLKSWYLHDLMVQPSCPTLSRETGRSSTNRARRGTIVAWWGERDSGVPHDVYLCVGDVYWPRGTTRPLQRAPKCRFQEWLHFFYGIQKMHPYWYPSSRTVSFI